MFLLDIVNYLNHNYYYNIIEKYNINEKYYVIY